MASTKMMISFSISLLATAAVLSAADVSHFCKDTADKALCTDMVKGGKNWAEAMTNALKYVQKKAKVGKPIVDSIGSKLPGNLQPQTKESIVSTCQETYSNMIYNIQACIGFVTKDPSHSLRPTLSATFFADCTDAMAEFDVSVAKATDFANEIGKIVSNLLALAVFQP